MAPSCYLNWFGKALQPCTLSCSYKIIWEVQKFKLQKQKIVERKCYYIIKKKLIPEVWNTVVIETGGDVGRMLGHEQFWLMERNGACGLMSYWVSWWKEIDAVSWFMKIMKIKYWGWSLFLGDTIFNEGRAIVSEVGLGPPFWFAPWL